jgi:hypothetical protein
MLHRYIQECLSKRKNKILTVAEAAFPPPQFKAFRKIILDEFGQNGLESDLEKILANSKYKQER